MPTIVIAGGGIAGLEALIALHGHLGSTARIELLEGNTDLVERQRAVAEPFGGAPARRFDLVRIAADHGAHLRPDRLASVDTEARRVRTVRGDTLDYDALLIAVGATPDMAIPGALTFTGPRDVGAFSALLADLDAGRVQRVAFAVPGSVTWTLPLYELALMTGEHVRSRGLDDVGLVLVTPEHSPLEAFGARIASHIRSLLAERDIAVCTHSVPLRAGPGGLIVAHGSPSRPNGSSRCPGSWARGSAGCHTTGRASSPPTRTAPSSGPMSSGRPGTAPPSRSSRAASPPSRPLPRRRRSPVRSARTCPGALPSRPARDAARSRRPQLPGLPPRRRPDDAAVVAADQGRRTAPLRISRAAHAGNAGGESDEIDVGELLLGLAERHATVGEDALALRCLDAAAQVRGGLAPHAAPPRRANRRAAGESPMTSETPPAHRPGDRRRAAAPKHPGTGGIR